MAQHLLHLPRQSIEATAHIRHPGCQPDAAARGQCNHPRSTSTMRRNARASTCWSIRRRQPFDEVISIGSAARPGLLGTVRISLDADAISALSGCAGSSMRTGTNAAGSAATSTPSRTCRRQVNNNPGYTPCRAATSVTRAPGSLVSATIRSFSPTDQRRRRSRPVMISIAFPDNDPKLRLMHSFKVTSLRHTRPPRKAWLHYSLPFYIFCGRHLLAARRRRSNSTPRPAQSRRSHGSWHGSAVAGRRHGFCCAAIPALPARR
jgi:hypothetical protein